MCEPTSIAISMMAVSAAMAASGASDAAKSKGAMIDGQRKNQQEIIKQANMQDADTALTMVDKREEAQRQLTEVNLQALRNRGTINAAVGESGMSGNSIDRIRRSADSDASAEKMNITENYNRDYAAIFQNRVGAVENARSAVRGGGGRGAKVNNIANALNIVGAGLGGYAAGGGFSKAAPKGAGTPQGGPKPS
ncbi:virion core protein, T7 gp14 family [Pseudomonas sp. DWRC2-2]|uniref:virion core protein, T7 gp14 family n=1 Tax=Pseudomonas sp. DWRC2-2 TaxID=2804567 RepID=UPI003CE7BC68